MTELKLEIGKDYKTRGGEKARVIGIDHEGLVNEATDAVMFVVGGSLDTCSLSGRYYTCAESDRDLVAGWTEQRIIEKWREISRDGGVSNVGHSSYYACMEASYSADPEVALFRHTYETINFVERLQSIEILDHG